MQINLRIPAHTWLNLYFEYIQIQNITWSSTQIVRLIHNSQRLFCRLTVFQIECELKFEDRSNRVKGSPLKSKCPTSRSEFVIIYFVPLTHNYRLINLQKYNANFLHNSSQIYAISKVSVTKL